MTELNDLLLFIAAGLVLNITPGPDMMFIITRSVTEGTKTGIISAFGIAAGSIFHMLTAAFGLTAILMAVPAAYEIIKYAGAAYLFYLAIKIIFSKKKTESGEKNNPKKMHSVFMQAALTNILNPKVALFFLAFLPQFVNPGSDFVLQIILLGLIFNFNGTIVNILVALTAGRAGQFARKKLENSMLFKWITASVYAGLGIRLALLERK